jgi:transcriptional regulator with XRE-family HTH domain
MIVNTLEERIRSSRKNIGVSASELARHIGVTKAAVSRWESGLTKHISSEYLFIMAHFLCVNPEWLATGKKSKQPNLSNAEKLQTLYNTELTLDEWRWLMIYRELKPTSKQDLYKVLKNWTKYK